MLRHGNANHGSLCRYYTKDICDTACNLTCVCFAVQGCKVELQRLYGRLRKPRISLRVSPARGREISTMISPILSTTAFLQQGSFVIVSRVHASVVKLLIVAVNEMHLRTSGREWLFFRIFARDISC